MRKADRPVASPSVPLGDFGVEVGLLSCARWPVFFVLCFVEDFL